MAAPRDGFREKRHRLPRHCYRGNVLVSFHACIARRRRIFIAAPPVDALLALLSEAAGRHACAVRAYCFMPDHLHVILRSETHEADAWLSMTHFKALSGAWLAENLGAAWQKGFYDEILRDAQEADAMAAYVLANPVREKMVEEWWQYPFSGPRVRGEHGTWFWRE